MIGPASASVRPPPSLTYHIDSFLCLAQRSPRRWRRAAAGYYVAGRGDDDTSGFASAPSARGGHRSSIAAFSSVTKAATVEIQTCCPFRPGVSPLYALIQPIPVANPATIDSCSTHVGSGRPWSTSATRASMTRRVSRGACTRGVPADSRDFTPSTRLVSKNDGRGWLLFHF